MGTVIDRFLDGDCNVCLNELRLEVRQLKTKAIDLELDRDNCKNYALEKQAENEALLKVIERLKALTTIPAVEREGGTD